VFAGARRATGSLLSAEDTNPRAGRARMHATALASSSKWRRPESPRGLGELHAGLEEVPVGVDLRRAAPGGPPAAAALVPRMAPIGSLQTPWERTLGCPAAQRTLRMTSAVSASIISCTRRSGVSYVQFHGIPMLRFLK
jgi:hypothetical protein